MASVMAGREGAMLDIGTAKQTRFRLIVLRHQDYSMIWSARNQQ
jgi:hypothetical protein